MLVELRTGTRFQAEDKLGNKCIYEFAGISLYDKTGCQYIHLRNITMDTWTNVEFQWFKKRTITPVAPSKESHANAVIDLNENFVKYRYWSNSCGETHHWGEYDIAVRELPTELQRAYEDLFSEDAFGLATYLTEYDNEYGISFEISFNEECAEDVFHLPYEESLEKVKEGAEALVKKLPSKYKVLWGKDMLEFSDGTKESVLAVFIPWNVSVQAFHEVGEIVEKTFF